MDERNLLLLRADYATVVHVFIDDFSSYVWSLPGSARPLLEQLLDWNNDTERDLIEIAHHMLDWEEKLCPHLGLTVVDVHDIKHIYLTSPELQR